MNNDLERATKLFQRGKLFEAEAIVRGFLRKAPRHPSALHLAGLCAAQRGALASAIDSLERAVALSPDYVQARTNLGTFYLRAGRIEDAERELRHVLAADPLDAAAANVLGVLLLRTGRHDEAIQQLQIAVLAVPGDATFRKNLGDAFWVAGRAEDALPQHEAALELWTGPPDPAFFEHMWRTYATSGRREQALAVARKWLARDPENAVAKHYLAASSGAAVPTRASDAYVTSTFDLFAPTFDEQLASVGYRGPDLVEAAVRNAVGAPVDAVLDAGCGTGLSGPRLRPFARRLVGVDLSSMMIGQARARGCYDELVVGELTSHLATHPNAYDLIVVADTLTYFGDLRDAALAIAGALRGGGHAIATVEKGDGDGYELQPNGRYRHAASYVRHTLEDAHLLVQKLDETPLRKELEADVLALVVTAAKPGA